MQQNYKNKQKQGTAGVSAGWTPCWYTASTNALQFFDERNT